jgi:hypothetical protein
LCVSIFRQVCLCVSLQDGHVFLQQDVQGRDARKRLVGQVCVFPQDDRDLFFSPVDDRVFFCLFPLVDPDDHDDRVIYLVL